MKLNKFMAAAGVVACVYMIGKLEGARVGAKAVLDEHADTIPVEEFTVKLVDRANFKLSTTAKKGE